MLDEADHMADLGFLPAVTRILDATPAGGQRMLFSATLDRRVGLLVTNYLNDPALHAVAQQEDSAVLAEHRVLVTPDNAEKLTVAAQLASRPARTLFFVRTKHGADRLARQLTRDGVAAEAIHGNRTQKQRQRALDAFAQGHPRVLVATDVAARGIHVDDVELVVHFDLPNDHKDYLHRSGRTARAGASGLVVTLADESQVRELQRMHQAAGVTATRHYVERRPRGRAGDRDDRHPGAARAARSPGVGPRRFRPSQPGRPARGRPAGRPGPTAAAVRRGRALRVTADRAGTPRPGPDARARPGPTRPEACVRGLGARGRGLRLVPAGLALAGAA